MPRIIIRNAQLEPAVHALDAWAKWLRPGTLAAQLGAIKGALLQYAQGVYYDREALIDECALWDTTGEGDQQSRARKQRAHYNDVGVKIGEAVVMKDQQEFSRRMRELMLTEQVIDVPFLVEDKHLQATETQLVKDTAGLETVDFGALSCVMAGTARRAATEG